MSDTGVPLFDILTQHTANGRASFHTPGHKGRAGLLSGLTSLGYDLTELPDTASLYDGGDAIEKAEILAADAFGSKLTLFSAGGCTLCIQTMLLLGTGGGGRVIFARNSHRSAIHAAALLGITPLWAWPTENNSQVVVDDIAPLLTSEEDIRAVYITSPDYYGNLADIPAIAALCHAAGVLLLVDNAHGSHLSAFGLHPLTLGADMTSDSSHKTLPVLTGGAMLHIGHVGEDCSIDRRAAKAAMALFGSTSPSFPVLASLDLSRDWWQRAGVEAYRNTVESIEDIVQTAAKHGVGVLKGALRDPARLTLDMATLGIDGTAAATYFREKGCEPEYADSRFVVFIITPFNPPDELRRLSDTINSLPAALRRGQFIKRKSQPPDCIYAELPPTVAISPREALLAPSETVDSLKAAGRIAARGVCPCPPGIAMVAPGEIISIETAEKLKNYGFDRLVVVKLSNSLV